MDLTAPEILSIPPPYFPLGYVDPKQIQAPHNNSNSIPRIYESARRNAYCTEFERLKLTIAAVRSVFPNSPVIDYQMPEWIDHRLAMINSDISELKDLITAAETKASLKRDGKWVDVKIRIDLGLGETTAGGWRRRYGAPREQEVEVEEDEEKGGCSYGYYTEDNDGGSQSDENELVSGGSNPLSSGAITTYDTPDTTPLGSPKEEFINPSDFAGAVYVKNDDDTGGNGGQYEGLTGRDVDCGEGVSLS